MSSGERKGLADLQTKLQASDRYPTYVLLTCLAGLFATTFTITILGVSLKPIAEDLASGVGTIAWVITGPMLAQALALPLMGKLGDVYGHRRIYLGGFAFATAAALVTALAWSAESLIGLRTVAQLFGTATMPASTALIFSVQRPEERVRAMGWVSLVAAGAPVFGLAIGGVLVDTVGWRPLFLIQAGLSVLAFGVARLVLHETDRGPRVSLDWMGALWLALAAFSLTFSLNQLPQRGLDVPVAAALATLPIAIVLFVRCERNAPHPLIPLSFFTRRNFALPLVVGFFLNLAYMGSFIISPLLLMNVFLFSTTATSFVTMLRPLAFSAASPIGGSLGVRVGEHTMTSAGTAAIGLGMISFAIGSHGELIALIALGLMVAGIGLGLCQPSLSAIVGNSVDEQNFGIASSALGTANSIGAVAGISALTALTSGASTPPAFTQGYLFCVIAAALALVATRFIEPHRFEEVGVIERDAEAIRESA